MKKNVGIFIFDDAEVLDFAGPFEVFSVTSELNSYELFNVFTISSSKEPVKAVNGLSVNPDYDFTHHPQIDILIISGGGGTRRLIKNREILNWIFPIIENAEYTLSICSGARILGELGLLDNKPYCTHHEVYDHMKEIAPTGIPHPELRYIQTERIFTSGGISAGIDLSFHVIEQLLGDDVANKTAAYMEYRRYELN
ncbi:Transcriptional regulator, AraC family protein [Fulvivirga imtechensis AK7]|uniref:Transcriptional regulator, AraC family protein n=1 Tax=Fulvivirga imtechensis AK7 TaxID=1237149 RepID=L8JP39_9BACT|nr:DJ-1/PfpI family protein [Fulvivirga imtechensis]ELR69152.1 Transcriptional regulator, AraC family protein [Fulvivirga imtechensis AK7]